MDLKNVFRSVCLSAALSLTVPAVGFSQGAGKDKAGPDAGGGAGWLLSGPYMEEGKDGTALFDVEFPPEKPGAKGVQWRAAGGQTDETGAWSIDLAAAVGGENRVAYLLTSVKSAKKQDAVIELGSDDGVKAWVNRKVVHANNAARGVTPAEDKAKVLFQAGMNEVMLKITQGGGGWGAWVRFAKEDGTALGVTTVAKAGAGVATNTGPGEVESPSLEEIYARYMPRFSRPDPTSEELKFSKQTNYVNLADVQLDSRVRPIIDKANDLVGKGEFRKASEFYRRILQEFPDELYQIAGEGIFIPASLYVQRRILIYPKKELTYYRILFDPAAKEIYERAVKRYSIFDYKDLARYHLATSYGDDALYALANAALDNGRYNEARWYYEDLVKYHGQKDEDRDEVTLDRDHVWVRLAICYRHLGHEEMYREVVQRIKNRAEPTVARLLAQFDQFKYDEFEVRQREGKRSVRYDAMDDKDLSERMPYTFQANRGEWQVHLGSRQWFNEPEALPWATETDLVYKDLNVLYSRSLLTGELNWICGPGGSSLDWDYFFYGGWSTLPARVTFYPEQAVLVHDGAVFAHMFVYGPSLVAVDQYTGRMLWAKGPMAAVSEDEWLDRYQASPAGGRGMVVAPVVHDDIRGRAHISSSADLAAFESTTGKLLWRTTLARISPLKITQSRYPRKIRIFSSSPLVKDGVVYHVTNAGAIAAVDAQSGAVLWLTRYAQDKNVLDNFSDPGRTWRNGTPLIRDNKLYVTPVDSGFLLCLDAQTGRILWAATRGQDSQWPDNKGGFPDVWRMTGFSSDGSLCLSGNCLAFLDPHTGRKTWAYGGPWIDPGPVSGGAFVLHPGSQPPCGLRPGINGEGDDFWWPPGIVDVPPRFTKDGLMYLSMRGTKAESGGTVYSDYTMDLKTKMFTQQRRWWTEGFLLEGSYQPPVAKRVVNEEPEAFMSCSRMTFNRWGIPFEVDVYNNKVVVRYDRKKMEETLAQRNDLDALFAKAEVARKRGDVKGAIDKYESCKTLLPSEEEDRRRNLNLRLYPLYMEVARWGLQAVNYAMVEGACKKMGATASNPSQEIRALLAYADLHEKRGDWGKAVQVLQNASRHYWREPLMVSGLEIGDEDELKATAEAALKNLLGNMPPPYGKVAEQMYGWEKAAMDDYFLAVANVGEEYVVETRDIVVRRLRELLKRAPGTYRKEYETQAADELKRYGDAVDVGERLLWCWPEAAAALKRVEQLAGKSGDLKPVEKQGQLWRLDDLARACGLGEGRVAGGAEGLKRVELPKTMETGEGLKPVDGETGDTEIVRLELPQRGQVEGTAHLLFVGGRKKRAFGNRFTVTCWNIKTNQKEWESRDILLGGKTVEGEGYEVGFEEIFMYGDLAIIHGRYDVIALDWQTGKDEGEGGKKEKRWHFRVPMGFEIRAADLCGQILVLCGRNRTVGLHAGTGEIVWEQPEAGEFYAGPFFWADEVLTVRNSPSEVSFRRVGTGRLLERVRLAGLTTNRKHPIFAGESGAQNPRAAEVMEAYPVAFGEGVVAVSDGMNYHVVDVAKKQVRWSTAATKLDMSTDPAYRFWVDGGRLFVLKPYYSVLENAVFDLASGDMLWRRREGGRKVDEKLKGRDAKDSAQGTQATGLILNSMVFVGGKVYGVKYEMGGSTVAFVGMDPVTGNELMRVEEKGYTDAEAYVEKSWSKDCVVVRIQDGNKFEVWQVDVAAKKRVQRLRMEGYGRLGEYGDVSAVWQGPNLAIWTYEKRKFTSAGR